MLMGLGAGMKAAAFNPLTRSYGSGTGVTETVPEGATQCRVKIWAGGGSGNTSLTPRGGGAGGYSEILVGVVGGNSFLYTVGAGGAAPPAVGSQNGNIGEASSCSGTVSGGTINLAASPGDGATTTTEGAGGGASGGSTNTSGGGGIFADGGTNPAPGSGTTGGGGDGDVNTGSGGVGGSPGYAGLVTFAYT